MKKVVEILYFEGCPTWQRAVEQVHQAIEQADLKEKTTVEAVRVETDDQAQRLGFLGSPTIRVDGQDIDPTSSERRDFGLQCRVYQHGGRLSGLPHPELIRAGLMAEGRVG